MKKALLFLLLLSSFAFSIEKEYQNGFSFYLGIGEMNGVFGMNLEYQIQIINTHFSVSPFLGLGFSGSNPLSYSGGVLGEYGNRNKIQLALLAYSSSGYEQGLESALGYHLILRKGFTLFINAGTRYSIHSHGFSVLPAINLGFGYKI
jgi:hypothetical protein